MTNGVSIPVPDDEFEEDIYCFYCDEEIPLDYPGINFIAYDLKGCRKLIPVDKVDPIEVLFCCQPCSKSNLQDGRENIKEFKHTKWDDED